MLGVALLKGEVKRYRKTPERKCIRELLREVEEATTSPSRFGWWTGAPIERSWRKIHDAEILLVSLRGIKTLDSGRPELLSLARAALPEGDAQRVAAEKHLTDQAWTAPLDGHKKAVLRAQYAAARCARHTTPPTSSTRDYAAFATSSSCARPVWSCSPLRSGPRRAEELDIVPVLLDQHEQLGAVRPVSGMPSR